MALLDSAHLLAKSTSSRMYSDALASLEAPESFPEATPRLCHWQAMSTRFQGKKAKAEAKIQQLLDKKQNAMSSITA